MRVGGLHDFGLRVWGGSVTISCITKVVRRLGEDLCSFLGELATVTVGSRNQVARHRKRNEAANHLNLPALLSRVSWSVPEPHSTILH